MRLVLVGHNSFIARHVRQSAEGCKLDILALPRDANLPSVLRKDDVVMNFAISPRYQKEEYEENADQDLHVARQAVQVGARTVMLSTRRVYSAAQRWDARETSDVAGDETVYGKNKARTERMVRELDSRNSVFRLSNVFGMEYDGTDNRRTFFAQLMRSLKREGVIRFDMHPDTRRDFIPVEICARGLVEASQNSEGRLLNLAGGFPARCGDLADWVREGYGGGDLIVDPPVVRDEFFLNLDAWKSSFGPLLSFETLRKYCIEMGQRLRCAKS